MKILNQLRVRLSPFHKLYPSHNLEMACEINRRIAVDRSRSFIYFRIPKAANSTVILNIIDECRFNPELGSKQLKRRFATADSLSNEEINSLTSRFFLFTIVRNPFIRIASTYLDKIVRNKRSGKVLKVLGKAPGTKIEFLEFCRYIRSCGLYTDPHWYRQVDFIPCGTENLHFIGRVESLDADLRFIQKKTLGVTRAIQSWTPHSTNSISKLGKLYCSESIEIVRSVYAKDFETFGYSYETPWEISRIKE